MQQTVKKTKLRCESVTFSTVLCQGVASVFKQVDYIISIMVKIMVENREEFYLH